MAIDYTINLRKGGGELAVGQLVLIRLDTTRTTRKGFTISTAVGKVLEYKGDKGVIDVEGLGQINARMPHSNQSGLNLKYPARELELLAINTLATDNPETVHEYLDRLVGSQGVDPVAFHVTDIDDAGVVRSRIIGERSGATILGEGFIPVDGEPVDDKLDEVPLPPGLTEIGTAEVTDEMVSIVDGFGDLIGAPPSDLVVSKGDILIARGFSIEIKDGIAGVRMINPAVLGNAASTEAAVEYLGLHNERPDRHWGAPTLASYGQIQHSYDIGLSHTQPDKALALSYDDPNGERRLAILGSSGYHAFVNEDLHTYLDQQDLEPGLWVMHNLRNVSYTDHEGGWDADVEGDWLPATPDEVEELFGSMEAMDSEVASVMEIDDRAGLGAQMIKAAEVALFEEKFAEEHRQFAMKRFGVIDESHYSARQVANPDALYAYAAVPFADIDDGRLRSHLTEAFYREISGRSSLFLPITPTEAERLELAKETNWGRHKPSLFVPNEALDADREVIAAVMRSKPTQLMDMLERGHISHIPLPRLLNTLNPSALDAFRLPVFSEARKTGGSWHLVGRDKKWITLALFAKGSHVATLETDMNRHTLKTAQGLRLTNPHHHFIGTEGYIPVHAVVLDADRAVCEIEARHWRDYDMSDLCVPARDGIHTLANSIAHISDGVLHRENGPALLQGLIFGDSSPLSEHRFRGNLHREEGPAMYQGEHAVWYRHGLEHRTGGPSTVLGGGEVEYRLFDMLHREDGPAIEGPDGRKSYYICNRLHREDGPAIVNRSGEMWYRHGSYHREGAPAVSQVDGAETYYVNGVLHNEYGPAHVCPDGDEIFAIDGVQMGKDEFLARMPPRTNPAPLIP